MKCPSCNKFAGLDTQEPELNREEFDADTGTYEAEVRIVRNSACCGDEMKEANFNFEGEVPDEILIKHKGEGHELEMEFDMDLIEEGGGRYAKSFYGVNLGLNLRCSCQQKGDDPLWTGNDDDKVAASEMEELV